MTQQKGESVPRLVYRGILIVLDDGRENKLTIYPLLLCSGLASILRIVHKTLEECFYTVIRQQRLGQDNLKWLSLLTNWDAKKKIEYVYSYISATKPSGNYIQICLNSSDVQRLWNM